MKNLLTYIIISLFLVSCQDSKSIIWEENFDGTELNESFWNYQLGDGCPDLCGWGNNERQIYTRENAKLQNGNLIITATKKGDVYKSTRITTKDKIEFQYGTIEVKAKLPTGQGLWPAVWMLGSDIDEIGWPDCGEIDILEYVGKEPHTIYTSLHTRDSHGNTINSKKTVNYSIEEGFHIYKCIWTAEKIEFYLDDQLVYTFSPEIKNDQTWPFNKPFYIIINLAIGGNFGGPEVDDSIFPKEFEIDYIKIWQ
ncbi:glycoside hydrolase family 16 protein [uncultured Aquimarina sp.]|uniref:glycoside hydrolase family 16 protein n=1 Tax=uncultured Aquimarina sp. TaxID=575652 RepID=UPI00262506B5|nr:glycoside hydrolase family 16 protein [uncultured Aquimarina sp.]